VDAAGANNGASWGDAFNHLQDALAAAASGDQIWVAEGVYYPDLGVGQVNNDRSASFVLVDGVAVYGGFDGTESDLSARDWTTHITVLSGDLEQNDTVNGNGVVESAADIVGSNAYNVTSGRAASPSTVLDGFTLTGGNADSDSCPGPGCGGGMVLNGNFVTTEPTLANLIFIGNSANFDGGGLASWKTASQMSQITFSNNTSGDGGGGMMTYYSTLQMDQIHFENNTADLGGGLYYEDSELTLTNSTFTSNTALHGGGIFGDKPFHGDTGILTLTDVTFSNNTATDTSWSGSGYCNGGGGIGHQGVGTLNLTRVTFSGNTSQLGGAGLFIANNGTTTLTDVDFTGNQAQQAGGGLFSDSGDLTISDSTFTNNQSLGTSNANGGAIAIENGTLDLSTTTISGNSAYFGGGLLFSDGVMTLANVTITDNTATEFGGGIYARYNSQVSITSTDFTENQANYGGGIYNMVSGQTLTLDQVTFTRNTALEDGGGIHNRAQAAISNAQFLGNSAANGGGMSTLANDLTTLENVIFVGNQAREDGGGFFAKIDDDDSLTLAHAVFVQNQAGSEGGGLHNYGACCSPADNVIVANSIFWDNSTQIESYLDAPVVRFCDVQGGYPDGSAILDADPLLTRAPSPGTDGVWGTADDDYGDLRPTYASPVIEAGNNADCTQTLDLDGNPRLFGVRVDLGPFETTAYRLQLPLMIR
jgi:predicted outer membrane repeat protein